MSLTEWLDENDVAGMEPTVITDKYVNHLLALPKAKLRSELPALAFDAVSNQMRLRSRMVEDRAIDPRQVEPSPDAVPVDPLAARREFLSSGFRSPARDGAWVTWGQANSEDHRSYAERLHQIAAGTLRTASRHEKAADKIENDGVQCLDDIENFDPTELDR